MTASVSESSASELENEEEGLEGETCDGDVAAELGQVVLAGFADLPDDAVETQPRRRDTRSGSFPGARPG